MENMEIPVQVHERCVRGVQQAEHEKRKKRIRGMAAVALMVLLGTLAVRGGSVAQSIRGFFTDVVRWDGAVVGTKYEQATSEVQMQVVAADKRGVTVEVTFLEDGFPWRETEEIALGDLKMAGVEGLKSEKSPMTEGKTRLRITWEREVNAGTYILEIGSVWGYKKADQPLECEGEWNCRFTVK